MSTHLGSGAQALGQVAKVASRPFPEHWSQVQGGSGCTVPPSRAGQSPAPQLPVLSGMLQRAQVPTPRATRCPTVPAAPHRDADMRSVWVFGSAPGRAAAAPSPAGACSAPSPEGLPRHRPGPCAAPAPPALPAAAALCLLSSRSAALGTGSQRAAAISKLPDQRPAGSTRLGWATCASPAHLRAGSLSQRSREAPTGTAAAPRDPTAAGTYILKGLIPPANH